MLGAGQAIGRHVCCRLGRSVDYPNGTGIEYGYSAKNRIASISHRRGGTLLYDYSYTYDGNGNRMTQVEQNDGISEQTVYGYDPMNRLRMFEVSGHGAPQRHEYDYDGYNRAAERRYVDGALVEAKSYVYDETNWLLEVVGNIDTYHDDGAVLEEYDASDGSLLAYYEYADRLVALVQPQQTQYYHHDALGSTIGLTDQYGNDAKSYHLDPWGNIRWETGSSINRHIFTGKQHDANTGLVYFGARYYDPEVGRFITQDSYLGEPNTPPSLHRYLYAYSNPTVYIDLQGYAAQFTFENERSLVYSDPENDRITVHTQEVLCQGGADCAEYMQLEQNPLITTAPGTAEVYLTGEGMPFTESPQELGRSVYDQQNAEAIRKKNEQLSEKAASGQAQFSMETDPADAGPREPELQPDLHPGQHPQAQRGPRRHPPQRRAGPVPQA